MATLIDNPEFTGNEIYEIQATDPVEGAAAGASFGGIGISNEPHQQLANRSAFLKQRQDINIANIGVLQAFMAAFVGSLQSNGYLKIPILDTSRGAIVAIIQWGQVDWGSTQDEALFGPYAFPIPFPNACELFMPTTLTPEQPGHSSAGDNIVMVSSVYPPTASQFWV